MDNSIKISDSRKVVDIKELSTEETEKYMMQCEQSLKRLRKRIRDHEESTSGLIGIVLTFTIGSWLSILLSGKPVVNYDAVKIISIIEGALLALPTLGKFLGRKYINKKFDTEVEHIEEVEKEYLKKHDGDVFEDNKEEALSSLEELSKELTETVIDDHQSSMKEFKIGTLIEDGAKKSIINMPGIQRVFDIAINKRYPGEHRVFLYDKDLINEDGTFTLVTHIKQPYGCLAPDDKKYYEISYSEEGNDDRYLKVKCDDDNVIYINKQGDITSLEKVVKTRYNEDTITIPYSGEVIEKGHSK